MNTVIGFGIGIALNIWVLPVILNVPFETVDLPMAIYISLIYGGVGIMRSFILRRVYNNVRSIRFW